MSKQLNAGGISCYALAFFVAAGQAKALDPEMRISQYAHTAWLVQDGAFSGAPNAIAQTTDGYVWIGTDTGLVRFDGVRFVPWAPPPGEELPSLSVYSLLGARDGSLWIGTASGLAHWKNGRLANFLKLRSRVNAIIEDAEGQVWVTRSRMRDQSGGFCEAIGEELHCLGNSDGMELVYGNPIIQDKQKNFWVGSASEALRWSRGSWDSYYRTELKRYGYLSGVQGLAATDDGVVWVGFDKKGLGLRQLFHGKPAIPILPGVNASNLEVWSLFIDKANSLWIGTIDDGLYRLQGGRLDHFRSEDGLSSNAVSGFFEDREGDLWILTPKGTDKFRDNRVVSFSSGQGLTTNQVGDVLASRDGAIWVGNEEALDFIRGTNVSSIRTNHGLPGHTVTALGEDHAGRLWVGIDKELTVYEHGAFHPIHRPDGSSVGSVNAITEDSDGNVWASVLGKDGGLFRVRGSNAYQELSRVQIPPAKALTADFDGGIWLSLEGNLDRYRGGRLDVILRGLDPQNAGIRDILAESDGSVWASTRRGLYLWKQGRTSVLTSKNGLPCDNLVDALRDNEKNLWIRAACGIFAVRNSDLERWRLAPGSVVPISAFFDVLDGALPAVSSFKPTVSKSPDGRLWFANDTILQMIDPRRLKHNSLPPPVQIEQITADRKSYSPKGELRLPARTRDIEIDYTALSFVVPQKVRFRYKLDGRDTDWQEPGTRRQAFYNDLAPRKYLFHVIACNNDGVWNPTGSTLNFSVAPAYYQTLWFRLLCAGLAAIAIALLYRLRVRQIAAAIGVRFDERLAERTRIARELHDTLLQSFHGLMFRLQATRNMLPRRTEEAIQSLDGAIARAEEAIAEGRDAIQDLRSDSTKRSDTAQWLTVLGQELASSQDVKEAPAFRVTIEGEPRALSPAFQDELYRIAREVLRNAFQHAHAHHIEAEVRYDDRSWRLRFRDDGIGIDPKVLEEGKRAGHWGLPGIRERAKRIGARLDLWSDAGAGTEIELTVPASIAYAKSDATRAGVFRKKRATHVHRS
jgi:ligand-binding sensor domain-containing protein/signal transduction histidine kinase